MTLRTCLILTIWTLLFVSVATAADRPGGYVDVRDFAPPEAKADGEFDWNSAEHPYIQDAIDSITHWQEHGPDWHFAHGTVLFPPGTFLVTKEIRLPGAARLVGAGRRATIILGKHDGDAVINMKGASLGSLEHLKIQAEGTKTALILGRSLIPNNVHPSGFIPNPGGWHKFSNVTFDGVVTKALIYSIASEETLWDHCKFGLAPSAPAKHVFYTSRRDDLGVGNPAECVNTVQTFIGCSFVNRRERNGKDDDEVDALCINTAGNQYALFLNCYFVTRAGCWVRILVEGDYRGPIRFIGCGNEIYSQGPKPSVKAGIIISPVKGNNPTYGGLTFEDSSFSFQAHTALLVTGPMTLENFRYNHASSSGHDGNLSLYSVRNSEIRLSNRSNMGFPHPRAVIAGNATGNIFTGPAGSFQVAGADVGNVYRDTTKAALHGRRDSVLIRTEDYTPPRYLSGLVLSNIGAEKPVVYRLPPAEPGLRYTVVKRAAPGVTIAAAEGDRIGEAAGLVNGEAKERAAAVTLVAVDGEQWVVTGSTGTWKPLN